MRIEYTVQIWKEGADFIAHAMPLDVMSSGATSEDARRALEEAVQLFLSTAEMKGSLEQVLEESGYEHRSGHWVSPEWVAVERHAAILGD